MRTLYEPTRQHLHPGRPQSQLFPLLIDEQVRAAGPGVEKTITMEVGREAATLVMLAAIALAVARNATQWAATFGIAFGTWDIMFYLFLRLILGWPESLLTWDVLFLIPVPWVGPVLAPVIVSASMIVAGVWCLQREAHGDPVQFGLWRWIGIGLGAIVIVLSFTWDYRNIAAGGMPQPFHWAIFGLGEAMGVLRFMSGVRGSHEGREQPAM